MKKYRVKIIAFDLYVNRMGNIFVGLTQQWNSSDQSNSKLNQQQCYQNWHIDGNHKQLHGDGNNAAAVDTVVIVVLSLATIFLFTEHIIFLYTNFTVVYSKLQTATNFKFIGLTMVPCVHKHIQCIEKNAKKIRHHLKMSNTHTFLWYRSSRSKDGAVKMKMATSMPPNLILWLRRSLLL